jgi:uncharacterized ion transporter superfamily protein YfcC
MKLKVPNTIILLFMMMVLSFVLTYILPSGNFKEEINAAGETVVVANSYTSNPDKEYLSIWSFFSALPRALADAQGIIFFVLLIGGALAVIRATGTIDAFIGKLLYRFHKHPKVLIFSSMLVFSIGSSTLGMAEEYMPFIPILVAFCVALRMDALTAAGIMVVGYSIGYGVAAFNPFTVLIAQEIAGVPPTSGYWFRLILFVPFFLVGWLHVQKYALSSWKMSGSVSTVSAEEVSKDYPAITAKHWMVLIALIIAILIIVFGIAKWHWYLVELGAVFFALTIIVVFIGRLNADKAAITFGVGASELASTALMIGFARSVALILEDGEVMHTIVYYLSVPLQKAGPELAAVGMFFFQSLINLFIPSGSGQAFITMPLMTPMADILNVTRQTAVLAYQFGDGFTNMIVPTNAVLMGIIGMAGITYGKWFKFVWPLMIKIWITGTIALVIAVLIGYK